MKVAAVSASLLLIAFLLSFSLSNGQTFQYSRGWTNGKRADPFSPYAAHTDAPWNSEDAVANFRLLQSIDLCVFEFLKVPCFISFSVHKAMGAIAFAGTITAVRLSYVRIRLRTEHESDTSRNRIAFISTATSETRRGTNCIEWSVAGQCKRSRRSIQTLNDRTGHHWIKKYRWLHSPSNKSVG